MTYPGEDRNPLEEGDGLSLTLTRHACSMLDWEYEDGICRSRADSFRLDDAGAPKKRALQKEHLKKAPGNRSTPKTERPKNGAPRNRFYSETVFIQKPE